MTEDTIGALITAQAALGDKPLLVADKDRLTYGELDRRSRLIAGGLLQAGVARGSRVAMLFGNKPDFVATFAAITRIGAVALPISTMSTEEELRGMLDAADVEHLITDHKYRNRDLAAVVKVATGGEPGTTLMSPDLPVLRRIWVGLEALEAAGAGQEDRVAAAEAQVTPADVLVVVHTSGSTSKPKGVVHTQGAMIRHARNLISIRRFGPDDRLFSNSPFFWIGGLVFSLLSTIVAGARLICSAASPAETLDLIEAERPNLTNGFVGTIMNLVGDPSFAGRDLSFVRGGNLYPLLDAAVRPKDPELRHAMLGMTETGSVYLLGDHEDDVPESQRGSFGRPAPGMQTRLVDPDSGKDTTEGEMWVRGYAVMQGYYGQELRQVFTPDGWFRTGDLMRVDADGFYYFKGRGNAMIKTAGANVSPREVEAVLAELCPGRLPIVLGLPDAERGQIVAAVIVGDGPVDEGALRQAVGGRLSRYKVPRRIVSMSDAQLPKLSSGKVDMTRLAEVLRAV
jgi:acyl-CoA synthetase (AMP-forming)/AMP-acid ligase II